MTPEGKNCFDESHIAPIESNAPGISLPEALEKGAQIIGEVSDLDGELAKQIEEQGERNTAKALGFEVPEDEDVTVYMNGGPKKLTFVTYPKPGTERYDQLYEEYRNSLES